MDNHSIGTMIPLQPLRIYRSSGRTSQASAAASEERRAQITADLDNGVHECAVCSENLNNYSGIWSCQDCHNIFHHDCIFRWATRSGRFAWPCPACKSLHSDPGFFAKCWCRKSDKHSLFRPNGLQNGNSCGEVCERLRSCRERTCDQMCERICHPGICDEVRCTVGCKNFAVEAREVGGLDKMPVVVGVLPREPRPYRIAGVASARDFDGQAPDPNPEVSVRRVENPNCYQRFARRWKEDVPAGSVSKLLTYLLFVAFLNGLGALWAVKRNERVSKPLQHQEYTEDEVAVNGEFWASLIVGIPLVVFPAAISGLAFACEANTIAMKAFALTGKSGKLFLIRTLLFLFVLGSFACYIILQVALPMVTWNKQFEHGCDGFDAMVSLDRTVGAGKNSYVETTNTIQLYDPRLGDESFEPPGTNAFNLSTPVDISKHQTDNFYSFHRMTGTTNTHSLAIDFDLHHHAWRMLDLSPSTPQRQHRQTLENSAILTDATSNLLRNGTWNQPTKANPHLTLPELNLLIPAFRLFQKNCHYQPFMKVYNTSGMSQRQIEDVSWRQWSGNNEEGVVMRTRAPAEFSPLSVCYRKGDFNAGSSGRATDVKKGLGDEGLVPMGLMAVMRVQLEKDGKAGGCAKKSLL